MTQNIENYEICFDCMRLFLKHELYRDWDSYYAGLFYADKYNERMYNFTILIQRDSLWRCPACRPFISSNLIGRRLEPIDENKIFVDYPIIDNYR
jgi:hypothetical protein